MLKDLGLIRVLPTCKASVLSTRLPLQSNWLVK